MHLFKWFLLVLLPCTIVFSEPVVVFQNSTKRYQIKYPEIGRGGFGKVYQAKDLETGKEVAIKIFNRQRDYEDEIQADFGNLYQTEAKNWMISYLDQGIISQKNSFVPNPAWYGAIVMEKVDGNLDQVAPEHFALADGFKPLKLSRLETERRAEQIGKLSLNLLKLWSAMATCERAHRDIKSPNVGYIDDPTNIRLLDIGTIRKANLDSKSKENITRTHNYVAPELNRFLEQKLKPNEIVGNYADLYSIGVMLKDLICGYCTPKMFNNHLNQVSRQLSSTAKSRQALNGLYFAKALIDAADHNDPEARFKALRQAPLNRMIEFEPPADGSKEYWKFKPTVSGKLESVNFLPTSKILFQWCIEFFKAYSFSGYK